MHQDALHARYAPYQEEIETLHSSPAMAAWERVEQALGGLEKVLHTKAKPVAAQEENNKHLLAELDGLQQENLALTEENSRLKILSQETAAALDEAIADVQALLKE